MKEKSNLTFNFIFVQIGIWTLYAPIMSYTSVFLLSKGFSNTEVGVIAATGGTLSAIAQPFIASYADKKNSLSVKSLMLITTIVFLILSVALIFTGSSMMLSGICFGSLIALLQLTVPLGNSLAMESINAGRDINYGMARGTASFAYSIITFTIGRFTVRGDIGIIPALSLILGIFLFMAILLFPFEKARGTREEAETQQENPGGSGKSSFIKKYPKMVLFLIGAIFTYIGHSIINGFLFQIMELKGGTSADMGLSFSISALSELPAMLFFVKLIKIRSSSFWVKLGSFVMFLKIVFTLLVPDVTALYFVQSMQSVGFAVFVIATVYYANQEMDGNDKIKGQAYMTMATTLGVVLSSMLGGWLIDEYGTRGMLLVGCVIGAIGCTVVFIASSSKKVLKRNI